MKKILLCAFSIGFITVCQAQEWVDMLSQPGKNFYEIQTAFNSYWKDKDVNVNGQGYKQFRRWESFMEPRVYPSGDLSLVSNNYSNFLEFLRNNLNQRQAAPLQNYTPFGASTTWTAVGPMGPMTGNATNGFPRKAGRDNFIAFHPTVANTFWVGAPAGGLWKTTDGGVTWTTNTDYLTVIGCSDLAIDPTNTNIMYLATGDGDAGDTYCIGVLKSTDGGTTWNTTGLSFAVSSQRTMRRLIINPVNPQILFAATNVGVYRTTNGGSSWTLVASGNYYDLEFKPSHPNTIYAAGTTFARSTNGGSTFSTISSGIPTTGTNRFSIAVTPSDTNYVYALRSLSSNSGFGGLYRSMDGGTTFNQMSGTPNVLANSCAGSGTGGQGWYDLALSTSPNDPNYVDVGGVNVWSSNSGGSTGTWTCTGCWIGVSSPSVYVHADHHALQYHPNGTLYAACDGGVFRYNGNSWSDLNNQRNIAQIYKIGLSGLSPNKWITGHQDNGSNIYNGTTYQASYAGDGMDCFIDRTNDNNMFASNPYGSFRKSTNGGGSWSSATSGLSGSAYWVAPWKQDPIVATRLYAGLSNLFVSNNLGTSWSGLTATGGSGAIYEFAIAPSNNQIIYVIQGNAVYKSTTAGTSWSATGGSWGGTPTFITMDPFNPNNVWITVSGYSAGNKVFKTTDGGSTWNNISTNLPNLPANCSVYEPGSNGRLYVGMDVGVYYIDNTTTNWTLYNSGLPNVPISDMEISPAAPGKLRAATYGRGVYEVDVVPATAVPVTSFTYTGLLCPSETISLQDQTVNSPNTWAWSVLPTTGASLSSTSAQNPVFSGSAGTYTISLVTSNSTGMGNSYSQVITIQNAPTLVFSSSNATVCIGTGVQFTVSGAGSYTWQPGNITGATVSFTPMLTQTYTCSAMGTNGCGGSDIVTAYVSDCVSLINRGHQSVIFSIYPNPANDKLKVHCSGYAEVTLVITDASGKSIMSRKVSFDDAENDVELNTSGLTTGVYFVEVNSQIGENKSIKFVKQ